MPFGAARLMFKADPRPILHLVACRQMSAHEKAFAQGSAPRWVSGERPGDFDLHFSVRGGEEGKVESLRKVISDELRPQILSFRPAMTTLRPWHALDEFPLLRWGRGAYPPTFGWRLTLPEEMSEERHLAQFCHDLATRHDMRAHTLSMMNLFSGPARERANLSRSQSDNAALLASIEDIRASWATELDVALALDAQAGTQANAGLVHEMHLERTTLEFAILYALFVGQPRRRNRVFHLSTQYPPRFDLVAPAEMWTAGLALAADGWIEGFNFDPMGGSGSFVASAGPKLRKLFYRKDALKIWPERE